MRIYGNREIKTLAGQNTRPTTSKVREAIFNIWQHKINGSRWLDLCAGNGTMGAEALCRGAIKAVAIEKSPRACQIIRENWQKIAHNNQEAIVLKGDILKRLKGLQGQQFDLIYLDPPYHLNLYNPTLQAIFDYDLLSSHGEIATEFAPKKSPVIITDKWQLLQEKFYGNTNINFYGKLPTN
ncbi:16S rRNA (guanine(966)-N(2))-methyltransferase RsmD [Cyanobacterium stanieri LEGE 03274]|uniref:16S rRNA (Guanine(966)-N(2))-methyltransferase RsmD n=1 Tax=Cyanobacterium stanieri LEGE 03274 TaxID=1828756 RepID=A0ABR9UZR1_9CHRO|nr:16S rRNA (guanine(966)-N(2))-methyltransferase RsmD [Cyanobacterium stanieri]MBE9221102.1 16S rRNA (guanine(966)-N(2))-methyltransferase RsmD [Cyanobacterium stanieri LEGE 03274]